MNNELKNELIRALFALRNLHFHRFGGRKFGVGGAMGRQMEDGGDGLNMPAFTLLKLLQEREEKVETGGALLGEMGDYLCVSKAAISQMLGSLESRRLITREADPENRRTIIVKLTEKGREVIERSERLFDSEISKMIDRFGEKDTKEIIRLIYKFVDIVNEVRDDLSQEDE